MKDYGDNERMTMPSRAIVTLASYNNVGSRESVRPCSSPQPNNPMTLHLLTIEGDGEPKVYFLKKKIIEGLINVINSRNEER